MNIFNPEMLSLARDYRGYSQTQLAKMIKEDAPSQATLSKIEKGELKPSNSLIEQLATILEFDKAFFFQPEKTDAFPLSLHAYRKKASTSAKALDQMHAEMILKISHYRTLELFTSGSKLQFQLPAFKINEEHTPEKLAIKVREIWGVKYEPIGDLISYVESSGIPVFMCNFENTNVDGVSLKFKDKEAEENYIFLNANQPNDRIRFTLAHELCHILAHHFPTETMEKEADRFASELLMPSEIIEKELENISLIILPRLKHKWKASMGALIYKSKTLNKLTDTQYANLWREMSYRGFRKSEPYPLEKEFTKDLAKRFYDFKRHGFSTKAMITELSKMFCIKENDFEKLYCHDLASLELLENEVLN